ncbi:hypothetical protein IQ264_15745 [Phormidium sp. LEGE 05292]|uniref:hypothetical protein n=1 Tax=[Phormidium] sp. LEGE 05292 TaxID=767427 RepID=UPI00188253D9|nr:hypothetical protein [Phormidium sp. LEGE 05292]MBE9226880.1 hypothetical protein [Phormidium sp. LEGE 05292]
MEPITIFTAIATVLATKALEKTGENIGDAVTGRVRQFWSLLKDESPDTASAIELAPEQALNDDRVILELQSVSDRNDELKQILIELAAAATTNPKLAQTVQPTIQNFSKLLEKGVVNQGFINSINQTII